MLPHSTLTGMVLALLVTAAPALQWAGGHTRRTVFSLPPRPSLQRLLPVAAGADAPLPSEELDPVIRAMVDASLYELPKIVAGSLKAVSNPTFFLRIAEMVDECEDEEDKETLSELSANVMKILDTLVQKVDDRTDDAGELIQEIVAAASEDDGELYLPLSNAKSKALREAVVENLDNLDEGVLCTAHAWMRKSTEENIEGMQGIMQVLFQFFAASTLTRDLTIDMESEVDSSVGVVDKVLATDARLWEIALRQNLHGPNAVCTAQEFLKEIESRSETIVLAQEAGSYTQRIQSEFLEELTQRVMGIKELWPADVAAD